MKIIRDEELYGLAMIPLFVDWHIRRCNVEGCTNIPTTIIAGAHPDVPALGLCEDHFQEANKDDGGRTYKMVFDDFNAFEAARKEKENKEKS